MLELLENKKEAANKKVKVLNFGSLNIDKTYKLDHIVNIGETISSIAYEEFVGGKGLNQSIALAKANAEVYHAGQVGSKDSEKLLQALMKNNVNIDNINKIDGSSGHAIIQIDKDGNNSIIVFGGSNRKISKDFIDEVLENFAEGDYLLLQNEINDIDYIIKKAKSKGMKIFFNPSPFDEKINEEMIFNVDCLLVNETEAMQLSSLTEIDEILDYIVEKFTGIEVILTLGKDGGYYKSKEHLYKFEPYKVEAVDSTGAGDTFCGFYIASIANDYTIEESLNIASIAGALACKKIGASNSIPDLKEVMKIYKHK